MISDEARNQDDRRRRVAPHWNAGATASSSPGAPRTWRPSSPCFATRGHEAIVFRGGISAAARRESDGPPHYSRIRQRTARHRKRCPTSAKASTPRHWTRCSLPHRSRSTDFSSNVPGASCEPPPAKTSPRCTTTTTPPLPRWRFPPQTHARLPRSRVQAEVASRGVRAAAEDAHAPRGARRCLTSDGLFDLPDSGVPARRRRSACPYFHVSG